MAKSSISTIWNYTILKQCRVGVVRSLSISTIWNYTILKLSMNIKRPEISISTIWNYTILKPQNRLNMFTHHTQQCQMIFTL